MVLLQEVDFASRRTYDIDQLQYIATALGWGFVARVITWECRYLPAPFWLPQRHVGRLRAGQGVISRYPLVQNTRQRLSQPLTQPLLAPLFSPYHTVQMVDMRCGERSVRLLNVHLEPRDTATRQRQAQELVAFVRHVATPNCVFMGALNSVAAEVTGRPADPAIGQDRTMDIITSGLRDRLRLVTRYACGLSSGNTGVSSSLCPAWLRTADGGNPGHEARRAGVRPPTPDAPSALGFTACHPEPGPAS